MKAIKGPAVFLAQFAGDAPPFNSLRAIAAWAAQLGFKGVQIPSWDRRLFDLEKAAESQTYCDEDRKSTRLNSSHSQISYAVFCLKKKNEHEQPDRVC